MNSPASSETRFLESDDSNRFLPPPVVGFERRRWDVADGLERPTVVEPVDPFEVANSTSSSILLHGPRRWIREVVAPLAASEPRVPICRIKRSAVQRATGKPSRSSCSHTLRAL